MIPVASPTDELATLLEAFCSGELSPDQAARLEQLVRSDSQCRAHYVLFMHMHAMIERREGRLPQCATEELSTHSGAELPAIGVLSATVGHFSEGLPLAYLVATAVVGLGLLIGSLIPVQSVSFPSPRSSFPSAVGQITGLTDCVWQQGAGVRGQRSKVGAQDPPLSSLPSPLVRLGDRFALSSGLMEITYDTGAKVILQGPATYEVESAAGGFLSVGKLTARVEKKAEGGRRKAEGQVGSGQWAVGSQSEIRNLKSEIPNPQSPIPNPSPLAPRPSPLFTIKTPTATVTDLGTEFGVEVDKQGLTTSHVFRGVVRLQLLGVEAGQPSGVIVLHENESVRTEKAPGAGRPNLGIRRVTVDPQTFVRRVARRPKTLDLLDIVAGGHGVTGRRERGVDPATGMEDPSFASEPRFGDRKYRPVTWHKLIDGVFVPDGGAGPMVVDSAGHTFDGFPKTAGRLWGSIWARAADIRKDGREQHDEYWIYAMGRGQQFMPRNFGLLAMHANVGITFNLEAMRTLYPGVRPARFHAVAGVADARGFSSDHDYAAFVSSSEAQLADIWVLIDGRLKMSRTQLRPQDGPVKVDVELGPKDRFLTLVSTDGGNTSNYDWVVLGDPTLEMASEDEPEATPAGDRKSNRLNFDLKSK
jgi:hypothetical protein